MGTHKRESVSTRSGHTVERVVDARREAVWKTLVNLSLWPSWDPSITNIEGWLGRGGEFVIRRNSSDGRRNRLQRIRVEGWKPGEVLSLVERWAGGVLEIERRFQLTESGTTTKVSITETRRGAAAPILRHQGGRIERSLDAFVDGIDIELKRSDRPRLDLSPLDLRIAVQLSRSDATAEAVAASLPEPARLVHQAVAALQHRGVITSTIDMNSQGRTEIVYSTTEFGAVLLAQSVAQTR